jgi:hypothetical protein
MWEDSRRRDLRRLAIEPLRSTGAVDRRRLVARRREAKVEDNHDITYDARSVDILYVSEKKEGRLVPQMNPRKKIPRA